MASFVQRFLYFYMVYSIAFLSGLAILTRFVYTWLKSPAGTFTAKNKRRELPPDCLNNPELGNHCYVQLKYVKLHYVEKGDKTKPLLLFIHGFPEFWYSWRHQLKEFSKDYWVVAIDLRGFGDSEKPVGIKYYRMKYILQDIKNLIEAFGKEKATLVGHDWGGVIVWYFLMQYHNLVQSYIVLNAPHPVAFVKHMLGSFKQFRMSWYIFFFQLPFLPEIFVLNQDMKFFNVLWRRTKKDPSPYSDEDKEAYKFTYGKPGAVTPAINYYRANITLSKGLLRRLPLDGSAPKGLFLFGADDFAISSDTVEKTKRLVPNLDTEIIKDASHFVQQDDPTSTNKLIREFLVKVYEQK